MILINSEMNPYNGKVELSETAILTKTNNNTYLFSERIHTKNYEAFNDYPAHLVYYTEITNPSQGTHFLIVETPLGLYVTNHMYHEQPTEKAVRTYRKLTGLPVQPTKEDVLLKELLPILQHAFPSTAISRPAKVEGTMRLKLTDPRTKLKYDDFIGAQSKRKPYLKPDYTAKELYGKRTYFVEVERTCHDEDDFLRKLMKIYMLGRRTYFIFNGDKNYVYHTELIAKFERLADCKFDRLYYATIEQLKFHGQPAFQKHV